MLRITRLVFQQLLSQGGQQTVQQAQQRVRTDVQGQRNDGVSGRRWRDTHRNLQFRLVSHSHIYYNFCKDFVDSIADLASLNKESAPIDVIGVCKSVGDVTNLTTRDGRELVKREIQLVDKSSTEVALTLWGTTATNFQGSGFPIVAVKVYCFNFLMQRS